MSAKTQKIVLTDTQPVMIELENWPVLCAASEHDYEGQHESQSFRNWYYNLTVRQHDDGRTLVYGTYRYETAWQSETSATERDGFLLESPTTDEIIRCIQRVAGLLSDASGQEETWRRIAREAVADMPPVPLG